MAVSKVLDKMSSKEEEEAAAPATPDIDFPLQAAVYALMKEANVRRYQTYEVGEWSRAVKESAWVISPFPLKKRPFEDIDGDADYVKIAKKKKMKEDQNPRNDSAEEEEESLQNEGRRKEDHHEPIIEPTVQDSLENEKKDLMKTRCEQSEDTLNVNKNKEQLEPRSEPGENFRENDRKKKEDDQEPTIEPAEDSQENKEKYQIKPRSEQAQDTQKNVKPRIEAVDDSWLNVRKKKEHDKPRSEPAKEYQENERGEEVQIPRIEQENQIAALMLLTYVAKYIRYWRRLHRYNESEHSLALPVKRPRVDLNDLADACQEYGHGFTLEPFAEKLLYDTKGQIEFLKILSDYKNNDNKNLVTNSTVMSEFVKNWVSGNPSETDWINAIDFLKMQHQKRLRLVERNFDYWDEDEQMIFYYGMMIWGSGVDVDSHVTEEKIKKHPIRARSTALKIQGDRDSQIVEKKTEKTLTKEYNKPLTHLDTENAIFKRVVLYKEKNGMNPFPDKNDFADFTKNWLRIEVRVEEFNELMNYLRKKYLKRAARRPFLNVNSSKTKAEEVLALAYKIWGW